MKKIILLTDRELKLFEIIRNIQSGEIRVVMKDGKPIRMEQIQKSIELD